MPRKKTLSYMDKFDIKDRNEAVREQKQELIKKIGRAQAILLLQETPKSEVRTRLMNPKRPKGPSNPEFSYLEHAYVSETLNWATMLNWDLVVEERERIDDQAVVHGYIEIRFPNMTIRKHASGGMRYIAKNPNMTWADAFNGATSRMLKVAASKLGIGLDLYRTQESTQEEMAAATQANGKQNHSEEDDPATQDQIQAMKNLKLNVPRNITFGQAKAMITKELQIRKKAGAK